MLTGRVTEFVKIGDTARRPATESSASVRQLLEHLEHAGFDGAPRFLGAEPDGSIVLSWVEGWVPAEAECWRLGRSELASVGELLWSYHDSVAGFAPGTGFEEGPQAVAAGQVVCHGDTAPRNTVFADGRATAFIDWDGIFVWTPVWDLAHAVWRIAPVCDDADRWLGGWPSLPDRSARIAALVGGYRLGAERADELADMVAEVIAGCARSSPTPPLARVPTRRRPEPRRRTRQISLRTWRPRVLPVRRLRRPQCASTTKIGRCLTRSRPSSVAGQQRSSRP